jgi:hypothetical protein
LQRRQKIAEPLRDLENLRAALGLQVHQDFADRKYPDRRRDKIDAAEKLGLAEGKSRLGGEQIRADGRDPKTDEHG